MTASDPPARSRAAEQAEALLSLNLDGATYVGGVTVHVDGELRATALSGEVDLVAPGEAAREPE